MNIHDRARQLVAQSKAPMTLSQAYSELARHRRRARQIGTTKREVAKPIHYAWQDRADLL